MTGRRWVFDPTRGGQAIPEAIRERTRKRILARAVKLPGKSFTRVEVSFRGRFCYIDAFQEPAPPRRDLLAALGETKAQYLERLRSIPIHLCRLRYFSDERWSLAIYTYSHERYETSVFPDGEFLGTPEQAFELCAELYG